MVSATVPLVLFNHHHTDATQRGIVHNGENAAHGCSCQHSASGGHLLAADDTGKETGKSDMVAVLLRFSRRLPACAPLPLRKKHNSRGYVPEPYHHQPGRSNGTSRQHRTCRSGSVRDISAAACAWRHVRLRQERAGQKLYPQAKVRRLCNNRLGTGFACWKLRVGQSLQGGTGSVSCQRIIQHCIGWRTDLPDGALY